MLPSVQRMLTKPRHLLPFKRGKANGGSRVTEHTASAPLVLPSSAGYKQASFLCPSPRGFLIPVPVTAQWCEMRWFHGENRCLMSLIWRGTAYGFAIVNQSQPPPVPFWLYVFGDSRRHSCARGWHLAALWPRFLHTVGARHGHFNAPLGLIIHQGATRTLPLERS